MKPYLSVIIPVRNGADELPLTLIDIDKHLSQQEYSYEILVVDDGSNDNTAEIVKKFTGLVKNSRLIANAVPEGFGFAIRLGMLTAKGNWRVVMDYRNRTPITEFNNMFPYLRQGFDILVGSRGKDFWCFSETAAQQIFSLTQATQWAFYHEFAALAKLTGLKIKRLAPFYQYSSGPSSRPLDWFHWFWEFIKIHWRLWRKAYSTQS